MKSLKKKIFILSAILSLGLNSCSPMYTISNNRSKNSNEVSCSQIMADLENSLNELWFSSHIYYLGSIAENNTSGFHFYNKQQEEILSQISFLEEEGKRSGCFDEVDLKPVYIDAYKLTPEEGELSLIITRTAVGISPLGDLADMADFLRYSLDGRDLLGYKMSKTDAAFAAISAISLIDARDIKNAEKLLNFFREGGVWGHNRTVYYFDKQLGKITNLGPDVFEIEDIESLYNEFQNTIKAKRVIIEVGPGKSFSSFSHLVEDSTDEFLIAIDANPDIRNYLVRNPSDKEDWVFQIYNFTKNDYNTLRNKTLRFAFPYNSGLSAALTVGEFSKGVERQIVVNGDAVIDLILSASGDQEFLNNAVQIGKKYGPTDYESLRQFIFSGRTNRTTEYNEFKREVIDNLDEYFSNHGFDVEVRYLKPEEIEKIGTYWAFRCAKTNDITVFLTVK